MQMLFDKINNGSPFGVIKEIFFYNFSPNNSPQLKQFLEYKRHFIGFVEIFIEPSENLFFVYENEPRATFNLKNYLLVLAKMRCIPAAICYCENKQDTQNTDTKEIKFLSAKSHDFGKDLNSINVELSNPNIFVQSLLDEVPRRELENIKLPDMKEIQVNQWYINIFIDILKFFINGGSYIIEGIKQELYPSINKT
ncbi:hypothetical protein ACQJ7G_01525 [Helicobacter pylori]